MPTNYVEKYFRENKKYFILNISYFYKLPKCLKNKIYFIF